MTTPTPDVPANGRRAPRGAAVRELLGVVLALLGALLALGTAFTVDPRLGCALTALVLLAAGYLLASAPAEEV